MENGKLWYALFGSDIRGKITSLGNAIQDMYSVVRSAEFNRIINRKVDLNLQQCHMTELNTINSYSARLTLEVWYSLNILCLRTVKCGNRAEFHFATRQGSALKVIK